jgi:O-antigen ligase
VTDINSNMGKMISLNFNERAHIFITGVIAFLLPAYPPIIAPIIVLLTVNWLFAPKLIIQGIKNILNNPTLILLISLYLLYLIGMLYTDNLKVGYQTIETKLSFLIFPLTFSTYAQTSKNNINNYLKLFIYGAIVNAIVCFCWASYCFLKPVYITLYGIPYNFGANYFYYAQLSIFMHPSYIAMYSVFALIALVHLMEINELKLNWKSVIAISLLILFVLLLSSKAGWICLLLFALYFFRWLVLKKNIISALLMMGLLISSFLFLNVYFTPNFSTRIPKASAIIETIKGNNIEHKKITTSTDGNGRRILVWKAATEIIIENFWIGVGTGDAKDKMLL